MNLQIKGNEKIEIDSPSIAKQQKMTDEHLMERNPPPALSLDERGIIQACNKSVEKLFGYSQCELVWQHISYLFPQLLEVTLIQENQLNPLLKYICHCDHIFEAINKQSDIVICNLNFFRIEHEGVPTLKLIVRPVDNASHKNL
jgi:PAS domain S-box-containing protein